MLLAQSLTRITVEVETDRLRPVDIPVISGSHQKLTDCTGWRPEISFQRMLAELLQYWRERP
jgi:GDP-4-dehydro-6-deoxy-D-mannose reductase